MQRRERVGKNGKWRRAPISQGWKPAGREVAPLPRATSPLADKLAALAVYWGPYMLPGQAQQAAFDTYGVSWTRLCQAVCPLATDPEVMKAKPYETRVMRDRMTSRARHRAAAREHGAADPLRHARKPDPPHAQP